MFIDFNQHSDGEINFAHVYRPGEIDLTNETAQIAGDLQIGGAARRSPSSEIAVVRGRLLGALSVGCNRCLQPLEVQLDIEFDEEFVTLEIYEKSSAERALQRTELSQSVYDGERIDLDDLTRELVLLNLPTQQICAVTCGGLCEQCGANKNTEPCSCAGGDVDPRWSALKELKIKN